MTRPESLCGEASKNKTKTTESYRFSEQVRGDGTRRFVIEMEEAGGFCRRLKRGMGDFEVQKIFARFEKIAFKFVFSRE